MKLNDDHYKPIKFALNRAVFHKELTDKEANLGEAEYDALNNLVEVTEWLNKRAGLTTYEQEQLDKALDLVKQARNQQ